MKRILFAIACLVPIFVYLSMSSKSEKIILIVGDSLSYAYGIKPKDSWISLLKERLADRKYTYKLVNFSIPGDETGKALKRFTWAVKEYKPVITILELGANDGLHHLPVDDIRKNLLQMIVQAKKMGSKVILMGMRLPLDYNSNYRNSFASIYPALAKQEQITLVPLLLKNVDSNAKLLLADKIHPVKEAQPTLLDNMWPYLEELL